MDNKVFRATRRLQVNYRLPADILRRLRRYVGNARPKTTATAVILKLLREFLDKVEGKK